MIWVAVDNFYVHKIRMKQLLKILRVVIGILMLLFGLYFAWIGLSGFFMAVSTGETYLLDVEGSTLVGLCGLITAGLSLIVLDANKKSGKVEN